MSRKKKTRRLRDKLSVKTGSKKNFLAPGQKGQIPSKNKLAKHKKRTLSAYQKHLEEQGLTDTSGQGQSTERPLQASDDVVQRPEIGRKKSHELRARKPEALRKQDSAPTNQDNKNFDELTGDDLWDLLDKD